MVQKIRDPVFSLQGLGSLLWHGFDPWIRNFHMTGMQPKKREGKRKEGTERLIHLKNGSPILFYDYTSRPKTVC